MCPFQETNKDVQPCGFGEIVSSLSRDSTGKSDSRKGKSTRIELSRFAEQHICKSVEWQLVEDSEDKVNKLWRVVVGRTDATNIESSAKVEMLKDLESVFFTVYKQNYSFDSKSKTETLYDNKFGLALEIRTPLNADDLVKVENLCWKFVPNDTEKSLIHSVDLELNLNSNTAFDISTQLPCLFSKNTIFKLSGLQMNITNIDKNGRGYFTITGVDEKIDIENRPSTTNLVVLCDNNKVEAGRKIISRDGYRCRTTIELPR